MSRSQRNPPAVLTIAGLDPTAGAGAVADALRIAREGAHPLVVISALTRQTTRGVSAVRAVDPRLFAAQIASLAADLPIVAAKTGLLPSADHVAAVARALPKKTILVVDPVLASSGGFPFLDARGIAALNRVLLPRADVVTPNLPELARLTALPTNTPEAIARAARALLATGVRAVLVKGGHAGKEGHARGSKGPIARTGVVVDRLFRRSGERAFRGRRLPVDAHGTGCALSSVLATRLALGDSIETAVARAIRRVRADLAAARRLGRGRPLLGLP